jgi:hypothetical protein
MDSAAKILLVLDQCCEAMSFPMLDNGYVYLAATRLTVFRSSTDWAIVIETFGFSPRAGVPDTHIHTFGSRIDGRKTRASYVSDAAFENYLAKHPYNESRFVFPIAEGTWQDADDAEAVAADASSLLLRGHPVSIPSPDDYARAEVVRESTDRVSVFELCRALAARDRDLVLATPTERRENVPSDVPEIMRLDEWHHPDVVAGECPSASGTFQQLARVLASGDVSEYRPEVLPNTHWSHWPDGGSL